MVNVRFKVPLDLNEFLNHQDPYRVNNGEFRRPYKDAHDIKTGYGHEEIPMHAPLSHVVMVVYPCKEEEPDAGGQNHELVVGERLVNALSEGRDHLLKVLLYNEGVGCSRKDHD